jgi:methylmalonyl-CoA epimerase
MIRRLDHVAIAVPDLQRAIRRFTDDLGMAYEGREAVPSQATETAFFAMGPAHVELVTPLEGTGPIAKFLEKRPGGLHHLCFSTDDIEGDVALLKAKGWQFLSDAPSPGAHGCRVIFVHPRSCDGVLIELSQPAEPTVKHDGES